MDDQVKRHPQPEPVDYAIVGPRLLAALRRRQQRRLFPLEDGGTPPVIPGAAIARLFRIRPHGGRESQRRGVRLLIEWLRSAEGGGHQVLAVGGADGGYYLAANAADLAAYADLRRSGGLRALAASGRVTHSGDLADAQGQLRLPFNDRSNQVE